MTFSSQIREEICKTLHDKERKYACLYGIFLYARKFTKDNIVISSESIELLNVMKKLTDSVFHNEIDVKIVEKNSQTKKKVYSFIIDNSEQIEKICRTYGIDADNRRINDSGVVNGGQSEFLAGAFLSCGSIVDPNKGYRLEFSTPTVKLCEDLKEIMNNFEFKCGISERKSYFVLYLENSENIEDLLTYMGAQQCTIDLINIKIYKDFRNKTNRLTNCDVANLNKTVSAAVSQLKYIKKIEKNMKLEDLPRDLYEIAVLRLENTEAGLEELGQMLEKPIGKSGVSRRFNRIKAIAESFQGENK